MNQINVTACIVERDVLRYTPAGIPIVSGVLQHWSNKKEAGVVRQVSFEVPVMAVGEISSQFSNMELGATYFFEGFLACKNKNSKALVFHIDSIGSSSGVI